MRSVAAVTLAAVTLAAVPAAVAWAADLETIVA